MTRFRARITMKPPTWLDRVWYRRINETPPLQAGGTGPRSANLARLVPYRFRWFHHAYATTHGFFWLPCPLCGREFGGHEWGKSIPNPARGPFSSIGICSQCSQTRPPRDWEERSCTN